MHTRPFDVSVSFAPHDFQQHRTVQFTHTMPSHWIYARPLFESGIDTVAMLDKPAGYMKTPSTNEPTAFLVYVVHGEMRLSDKTRSIAITPGMVGFFPDYYSMSRHCPVDTWFVFVQLTQIPLWSELLMQQPYTRICDYMDLLIPALGKMFDGRELRTSTAQFEAIEYARLVVELLKRELRYVSKGKIRQVSAELKDLISRIRLHPEYDWTLAQMATDVGTSKRSLGRLIKDEYDISPMELVIQYRIEKAIRYLTRSNMTICEIAEALNYQSTSSFSDLFVRYTGKRPGKLRKDFRARITEDPGTTHFA